MIQGIGNGASLAQTALEAALRAQQEAAAKIESSAAQVRGDTPVEGFAKDLAGSLADGVRAVDAAVDASDRLPLDMVTGKVTDFHEVAAQLKNTELTFKFALEVRNKLIEAYRETMRMSV